MKCERANYIHDNHLYYANVDYNYSEKRSWKWHSWKIHCLVWNDYMNSNPEKSRYIILNRDRDVSNFLSVHDNILVASDNIKVPEITQDGSWNFDSHTFDTCKCKRHPGKWMRWDDYNKILTHDDVIKWKHFQRLLAICVGNSPVTGEFPA